MERVDPYTTVCVHCPGGPRRKINSLFTPSELKRYKPRCRACVSIKNAQKLKCPGARVGYGWIKRQAKLSGKQVAEIRKRAKAVEPEKLAHLYSVSVATIRDIASGRTWKHV